MTWPHTLQERGPFTCPRCGAGIRFVTREGLLHDRGEPACAWLDEASDEQVEGLK
jgi:hypothetical protein